MRRKQRVVAGKYGSGNARHGLSEKLIEAMRIRQGDRCYVCRAVLVGVPAIDHDHEMAKLHGHAVWDGCPRCIRGLACAQCNSLLGFAQDNPVVLRRAADLLEEWRRRHPLP